MRYVFFVLWFANFDERVYSDRAAIGAHDEWVHIDAAHIGAGVDYGTEAHDDVDQFAAVHSAFAAERAEQLLGRKAVDHLAGLKSAQRCGPKHNIGDGLREDPPDSEHHCGAELGIAQYARNEFAVARDHRGDKKRDGPVFGCGLREQFGCGGLDGCGIGQAQLHQAALGLVSNRVAAQLHDHWVAEFGSSAGGSRRCCYLALVGDWNSVLAQERLGSRFRKGMTAV